jgi:tetratricopeptide (TPR) repeat protein/uncharacterized protein YkwD
VHFVKVLRLLPNPRKWFFGTVCGISAALLVGCGATQMGLTKADFPERVLNKINSVRGFRDLPPLEFNKVLNQTAAARVKEVAATGKVAPVNNRLPALIKAGSYARFALSHEIVSESYKDAIQTIIEAPLSKSKILHPSITHMGLGFEKQGGKVYVVIDFARIAPPVDFKTAKKALVDQLEQKRLLNSVDPLEEKDTLSDIAAQTARDYMAQKGSMDALISEAQAKVGGSTVAFGRVTVNFQVVPDLASVTIPERTSDPKLGFLGIGMAQGNHPDHEPGALAVVMLLTEPQTDHDATRNFSNVPPPKAVPKDQGDPNKPLAEQAWLATLTGNHQKAAKLFEKAYRTHKNPAFLYEAARANARDENTAAALSQMRQYAGLVTGKDRKKAEEMVKQLEKGETIFTATKKEKMSAEAQRFFVMGQSLFQRGEWDGAVDAFQQAYQYSQHPEIIYNIGLTHLKAGRIGDALEFFEEYQRLIPQATNVEEAQQLFDIGVKLYQQGQFESASRHFAMAYGFLPFPELVYNMALCYKAMGEKEKSIRFFQEYLGNDLPQKERRDVEAIVQELRSKR